MGTVSLYTKDELPLVDGVVRKMLGELPVALNTRPDARVRAAALRALRS
jgi:hypothetical protein